MSNKTIAYRVFLVDIDTGLERTLEITESKERAQEIAAFHSSNAFVTNTHFVRVQELIEK